MRKQLQYTRCSSFTFVPTSNRYVRFLLEPVKTNIYSHRRVCIYIFLIIISKIGIFLRLVIRGPEYDVLTKWRHGCMYLSVALPLQRTYKIVYVTFIEYHSYIIRRLLSENNLGTVHAASVMFERNSKTRSGAVPNQQYFIIHSYVGHYDELHVIHDQ